MDYTDYLIWKFVAVVVAAFIFGFLKGWFNR